MTDATKLAKKRCQHYEITVNCEECDVGCDYHYGLTDGMDHAASLALKTLKDRQQRETISYSERRAWEEFAEGLRKL